MITAAVFRNHLEVYMFARLRVCCEVCNIVDLDLTCQAKWYPITKESVLKEIVPGKSDLVRVNIVRHHKACGAIHPPADTR